MKVDWAKIEEGDCCLLALAGFWAEFGGEKSDGGSRNPPEKWKLQMLLELSEIKLPFRRQDHPEFYRRKFERGKFIIHPFRIWRNCFLCGLRATIRHHIIPLCNGGTNNAKNLISLCRGCHSKIHPWL